MRFQRRVASRVFLIAVGLIMTPHEAGHVTRALRTVAVVPSSAHDLTARVAGRATPTTALAAAAKARVSERYEQLPIAFEKNEGQVDAQVEFLARLPGATLFLNPGGEAVLALRGGTPARPPEQQRPHASLDSDARWHLPAVPHQIRTSPAEHGAVVRQRLVGARPDARAAGRDVLPGIVNHYVGRDPTQWSTGLATYAKVAYDDVYPGIDLVYYGTQRQVEYDLVVRPGGNPRSIAFDIDGPDRLDVDDAGDLVLHIADRQIIQRKPVVYQERGGVREEVPGRYLLEGRGRVRFEVGQYDRSRSLVIDPVLAYSTYLGGRGLEEALDIAVDGSGNAYVTGYTQAGDFPRTPGAFDTRVNAFDAFVTKLNPAGTALVYSTYIGGRGNESAYGIAVDGSGSAYVTGETRSRDFPTTLGAFDTTLGAAAFAVDAFVTKLDPEGRALVYSTYLGGSTTHDAGLDIAIDGSGSAYVTGYTYPGDFPHSGDFPTTPGAFDTTPGGASSYDAFVTKLDPEGRALVYSTYLGGSTANDDIGRGIAVDESGSAYVTGYTQSVDFPTTPGAFDTTLGAAAFAVDAFVTKLDPEGRALVYSTYLGGRADEFGDDIAVDGSGSAYVTGYTHSGDFPTTPGAFDRIFSGVPGMFRDTFVTKLNPAGAALVYSTYLGGGRDEAGNSIAIDESGSAYVTGPTSSYDFPTTADAFDRSLGLFGVDAFVTKFDTAGTALVYSTYLGGNGSAIGNSIAVHERGSVYVTGIAGSDFPTTAGAYDVTFSGQVGFTPVDGFVVRLDFARPDVDLDGDVDRLDVLLIVAARNTSATLGDLRDVNGDGVINVVDARLAALQCTRPRCATQ